MAEKKEKQYVSDNARLMQEWDWEKNVAFDPIQLTIKSNKKVWWKCSRGHSWQTAISHRNEKQGCPICSGKKVLTGFNDLSTTHPLLIGEWDFEKNKDLSPSQISKGSEKKAWWKCSRGHSWSAAVYSRTSGVGCPYCAKEFQSSFPEKAVYFYISKIFPDAIANYHPSSTNSFELDIFIPSLQVGVEYDGDRWHQKVEKDLYKNKLCSEMGIVLFRIREPACPILSDELSICIFRENKKTGLKKTIKNLLTMMRENLNISFDVDVDLERDTAAILEMLTSSKKEKSIYLQNSTLLNEWDYSRNGTLSPSVVTTGSDKKVWWICDQGHSYQSSVSSRTRGRSCSVCSGKKILVGFNDFKSRCPELAKDWDYTKNNIEPDKVAYGSDKKFWWICANGHSYQCSINNRRSGQACPFCSNKKILAGFNDINTTHPHIALEWDFKQNQIRPTEVSSGSHKKVWWVCSTCGYEWITPVYNRTSGHGCPQCAREKRKSKV